MKRLISFLFLLISLPLVAQTTIIHGYDATGNRIVRSSSNGMMMPPPQTKNFCQTHWEENQISDKKNLASK